MTYAGAYISTYHFRGGGLSNLLFQITAQFVCYFFISKPNNEFMTRLQMDGGLWQTVSVAVITAHLIYIRYAMRFG